MTQKKDNFIMLPKVDICFKGLMNNPKVRKGFIAALLQKDPETIRETELQRSGRRSFFLLYSDRITRMKSWGSWM